MIQLWCSIYSNDTGGKSGYMIHDCLLDEPPGFTGNHQKDIYLCLTLRMILPISIDLYSLRNKMTITTHPNPRCKPGNDPWCGYDLQGGSLVGRGRISQRIFSRPSASKAITAGWAGWAGWNLMADDDRNFNSFIIALPYIVMKSL